MFSWLKNIFGKGITDGPKSLKIAFYPDQDAFVERQNPLPLLVRGLYTKELEASDGFKNLKELLDDTKYLFDQMAHVFLADLPHDPVKRAVMHNHRLVLMDPDIYSSMLRLKKEGPEKLYRNNQGTSILFHMAAVLGKRQYAKHLSEQFIPAIYGIFSRYLGFHQLDAKDKQALMNQRRFSPFDRRESLMRENLIIQIQQALLKISEGALQFTRHKLADKDTLDQRERLSLKVYLDILKYSMLLEGRASVELDAVEASSVDETAQLIAVFSSVYAGHYATGKPFSLIVAEEYVRSHEFRRKRGTETTAKLNLFAIQDLMHLLNMLVIENFQGSGHEAIYSTKENLLIMQEETILLGPTGNMAQTSWQMYRSSRPIHLQNRDPRDAARCQALDPPMSDLEPLDYRDGEFRPSMKMRAVKEKPASWKEEETK